MQVARSSTEAEFHDIANTTAKIDWLMSICHELGIKVQYLATIRCNNQNAMHFATNTLLHENETCHPGFQFCAGEVDDKLLKVVHISNMHQWVDALTKVLQLGPLRITSQTNRQVMFSLRGILSQS